MNAIRNRWQNKMYDDSSAKLVLNSTEIRARAKREVEFILSELSLHKNAYFLDIPCGAGRHSYQLAKKGHRVVGLDISKKCLDIAKNYNHHKNITYKKRNMADLDHLHNTFDVLINLFTSFGYFSNDRENKKVLSNFYQSLKEDGKIVMQVINRDCLLRKFTPNSWHDWKGHYILSKRSYCPKTHYVETNETVINKKTGVFKTYFHRLRLYSKTEICTLLKNSGFKKIKVYGDFHGSSFKKLESIRPFYIASKRPLR